MDLISIMGDILIENSTSSGSFYPDVSFCALSSWFSDPTVLMRLQIHSCSVF